MPTSDSRIKRVQSFHELATTPFANGINALCWERTLPGDFAEVVRLLGNSVVSPGADRAPEENEGLITIQPSALSDLLSTSSFSGRSTLNVQLATRAALQVLLEDLQRLREIHRDPVLNLVHAYPRDEDGGPVATDVFSFHADSAPVAADTWLCTYHGPPSEGLRNEDAVRKVDLPATRAALRKIFDGNDDTAFAEFLHENHYDLHYAPLANARPYPFGLGHLWRIACDYPDAPIPPCIHRAPSTKPGDPPRLLLIS